MKVLIDIVFFFVILFTSVQNEKLITYVKTDMEGEFTVYRNQENTRFDIMSEGPKESMMLCSPLYIENQMENVNKYLRDYFKIENKKVNKEAFVVVFIIDSSGNILEMEFMLYDKSQISTTDLSNIENHFNETLSFIFTNDFCNGMNQVRLLYFFMEGKLN